MTLKTIRKHYSLEPHSHYDNYEDGISIKFYVGIGRSREAVRFFKGKCFVLENYL